MSGPKPASDITRNHILSLIAKGARADGRKPGDFRTLTVKKNVIDIAEGSAEVRLGKTRVIAGIKVEQGTPYPDTPDSGVLSTNAEMPPMADPDFESGPPSPEAIELARVVDRGIRESHMVDMSKLCITPGEKIWMVFVDIHVLDYDGNLIDAAAMAATAALTSAKIPASRFDLGEDYPLPVQAQPVSCTTIKLGNTLVFDPTMNEELIASARLTVVTNENKEIRAMQKGLPGSFTVEEIKTIINDAAIKGDELRKIIIAD